MKTDNQIIEKMDNDRHHFDAGCNEVIGVLIRYCEDRINDTKIEIRELQKEKYFDIHDPIEVGQINSRMGKIDAYREIIIKSKEMYKGDCDGENNSQ